MEARFFGSSQCKDCMETYVLLNRFGVDYHYIDALSEDDSIQDLCDAHDVEKLPHIQFLREGEIFAEHVGALTEAFLIRYFEQYFEKY